jgi:hypothetical protein
VGAGKAAVRSGMDLQETHATTTYAFVPADTALRACVGAIARNDARALFEALSTAQLPVAMAQKVADQAWRVDTSTNRVGIRMADGGLLSAVFAGTSRAQERAGTIEQGDNATTLVTNLAIRHDDPRVVDVLIDCDPSFRMGPQGEKATVDSTATFFIGSGATKCAARLLERKDDLVLSKRNDFMRTHAKERIVRNAQRVMELRTVTDDDVAVAFLEGVISRGGCPQAFDVSSDHNTMIGSLGLCLLGKPEIVAFCSSTSAAATCERVRRAADRVLCGNDVVGGTADVRGGTPLAPLLRATSHLRAPGVPDFVHLE